VHNLLILFPVASPALTTFTGGIMSSVILYRSWGVDFLAIRKNGLVIDIACSDGESSPAILFFGDARVLQKDFFGRGYSFQTEIPTKDLALYTHWPQHTKEFWDLLNET
jgi:hypothetical protein